MINILTKKFDYSKPQLIKSFSDNIFSWKELENILNLRPFLSMKRFFYIAPTEEVFNWPNESWLTDVNTYPPTLVDNLIRTKTCYIIDCSRINEKINSICSLLEILTKKPVDAHIYFTLNEKSKSFPPHKDENDNIILQVEGESNIKVWKNNDVNTKPVIDVILKKNDAVYIPNNMYHQAISQSKRLSISFAMGNANLTKSQERYWIKI